MRERKPIDAVLRRLLDEQAAAARPAALSDPERTVAVRAAMTRTVAARTSFLGLPNPVETRDAEVRPGLPARLYLPPRAGAAAPVLVYLHGGGWVAGSVATHDPFCRLLSHAAGVIVASIEYRRAPEHRHPAAVEDTLAAVQWALANAAAWGGDPLRLGLGGDSAGANLAAVAANRLCKGADAPLRALLLLYPVTDHPSAGHASYAENATGYGLEASGMRWFWAQYAPHVAPDDPEASPARLRQVPALPPTLLSTAEYDVLRDEGLAYADKLEAAGVAVTRLHAPDMQHNFPVTPLTVGRLPQCEAALAAIAGWLRATLAAARPGPGPARFTGPA